MAVDHILPEALLKPENEKERIKVLKDFGLDEKFEINSYENWLPAHGHCNNKKHDHVFRPTPLIQIFLDQARNKAPKAMQAEANLLRNRKLDKSVARLSQDGSIPLAEIYDLVQRYATANATPQIVRSEVVTPDDGMGFSYKRDVEVYVPPQSVSLGPSLTIVFEQKPVANSEGPFIIKTG